MVVAECDGGRVVTVAVVVLVAFVAVAMVAVYADLNC